MVDISFIVVSWNAQKHLELCLQSMYATVNVAEAEIFVIDNGSTDGSREFVMSTYPDVKLICNSENLGFAKANNIGIRFSTGRYLCFVNSDVKLTADCVDRMVAYMDENPSIGMLGPRIIDAQEQTQRSCMGFPTLWNIFCRALALDSIFPAVRLFGGQLLRYWPHDTIRNVEVINGCFWLVRREALNDVGLLDERFFIYGEDIDWCKRFWNADWIVCYYPSASAFHYGGASSANAPIKFYLEMQRANTQYWEKHHNFMAQIVYRMLITLHHLIRIAGQSVLFVIKREQRSTYRDKIKKNVYCLLWLFKIYRMPCRA